MVGDSAASNVTTAAGFDRRNPLFTRKVCGVRLRGEPRRVSRTVFQAQQGRNRVTLPDIAMAQTRGRGGFLAAYQLCLHATFGTKPEPASPACASISGVIVLMTSSADGVGVVVGVGPK